MNCSQKNIRFHIPIPNPLAPEASEAVTCPETHECQNSGKYYKRYRKIYSLTKSFNANCIKLWLLLCCVILIPIRLLLPKLDFCGHSLKSNFRIRLDF